MALGGGVFLTQNKVLPGSYINFVSAAKASSALSERGYGAIPMELNWGADEAVMTLDGATFQKDCEKFFGYNYTHEEMKPLRELFKGINVGHIYKLNAGGVKAENTYAIALCAGTRGNDIKIVIANNENSKESDKIYDVITYLDYSKVDKQTVRTMSELKANDFVTFKTDATIGLTAGTPLEGGTNGEVTAESYSDFLEKMEQHSFNVLGCPSSDESIKALFAAFTKRMRDEVGIKFQCVLHRYTGEGHEGIVSIDNNETPELVYWVTGIIGGCAVNTSNTNKLYNGEYEVDVNYTQAKLSDGIQSGKFILHKVMDDVRVLEDINTFVEFTEDKGDDFASNQTVRVLDQIANDMATLFSQKYIGKIANDSAGRMSLWGDIVKHHKELEAIRAIENFSADTVKVEAGDHKKSVVVTDYVTPVNAMAQLYMTIIIE